MLITFHQQHKFQLIIIFILISVLINLIHTINV